MQHKAANKGKQVQGGPLHWFSASSRRREMDSQAEILFCRAHQLEMQVYQR